MRPGDDPVQIWEVLNPPSSLPQIIDPACGWVQNVNETPWWFCDPPLDPVPPGSLGATDDSAGSSPFETSTQRDGTRSHDG